MKIYFLLVFIAALFAAGSEGGSPLGDTPRVEQVFSPDVTVVVTKGLLGAHECLDIQVGQPIAEGLDVLSLSPNCQERDTETQKAPLFSRSDHERQSTSVKDVKINSAYLPLDRATHKIETWNKKDDRTYSQYLQDLSRRIMLAHRSIVGIKYKIVPIDLDNFTLEDIQLTYRQDHKVRRVLLVLEPPVLEGQKETKALFTFELARV